MGWLTLVAEIGRCVLLLALVTHVAYILHFLAVARGDALVLPLRGVRDLLGQHRHPLILPRLPYVIISHLINFTSSSLHGGTNESLLAIKHITTIPILLMAPILITQFLVILPIHYLALSICHVFAYGCTVSNTF